MGKDEKGTFNTWQYVFIMAAIISVGSVIYISFTGALRAENIYQQTYIAIKGVKAWLMAIFFVLMAIAYKDN